MPGSVGRGRSSLSFLRHLLSSSALGPAHLHAACQASATTLFLSPFERLRWVTQFEGTGSAVVAVGSPASLLIPASLSLQLVQPWVP